VFVNEKPAKIEGRFPKEAASPAGQVGEIKRGVHPIVDGLVDTAVEKGRTRPLPP
jgi:hypothetical protein